MVTTTSWLPNRVASDRVAVVGTLSVNDYLRAAEAACAEHGIPITGGRLAILQLLAEAGRPMKAYDLLATLRERRPKVSPPTVYPRPSVNLLTTESSAR